MDTDLHAITKGIHNQYYDDINSLSQPYYDEVIQTKIIEFTGISQHEFQYDSKKGIKNICVEGDFNMVILLVDGQIIDKVFSEGSKRTLLHFVDPKVCLPFVHTISLRCDTNTQCKVTYDLVSINYGNRINDVFYYIFDSLCCIGIGKKGKNYVKLVFNQPVTKIIVDLDNSDDTSSVIFDPNIEGYQLPLNKITNSRWELEFGRKNYVNFSKLNNPKIWFGSIVKSVVVTAESLHAAKGAYGTFRLVFKEV